MVLNHHPHIPNTPRHPCQPRCLSRSRWPSFCVSTACMAETPPLLAAFLPFLSPDTLPFASRAFPGRAVGLSRLTLIIGRFSRDYRELRFKNTIIPLPCCLLPRRPVQVALGLITITLILTGGADQLSAGFDRQRAIGLVRMSS